MICGLSLRSVYAVKTVRSDLFESFIVSKATYIEKLQVVPTSLSRFQEAILCDTDTVAVAMRFAMKNGQICFSLRKFLAISSAIRKIASDCGCDAVVHLALAIFGPFLVSGPFSICSWSAGRNTLT